MGEVKGVAHFANFNNPTSVSLYHFPGTESFLTRHYRQRSGIDYNQELGDQVLRV